ncbi:MAG: type II secretion system protein [Candidatus Margulisiibacteriota bacterium]|jgi:prepilin-type N-terminal cleavage/methylation domain-containing protein
MKLINSSLQIKTISKICPRKDNEKKLKTNAKKGYVLLELIIALFIISLLLASLFVAINQLTQKANVNLFSQQVYHELCYARNLAITKDQDITCLVINNLIQIKSADVIIKNIIIPYGISVSSSVPFLGFKGATGFTKFAGTLTINKGNFSKAISLGVGFGKIQLK